MIKKLILHNIKSHKNATFEFGPGLTVIVGKNGSGKTTIIESLGWNLFDVCSFTKDEWVTYGQKWGSVTVEMDDGTKFYRDTKGKCVVTSKGVETTGKEEYVTFLKNYFQTTVSPQKMFSEIIGVRQALQIAQFMQTPRERKNSFDELFGMNDYDSMWKSLKPVESKINEEIQTKRVEIAKLEGSIQNKDQLIEKRDITEKIVQSLKTKITDLRAELDKQYKQKEVLEKLKSFADMNKSLLLEKSQLDTEIKTVIKNIEEKQNCIIKRNEIMVQAQEQQNIESLIQKMNDQSVELRKLEDRNKTIDNILMEMKINVDYLIERQKNYEIVERDASELKTFEEEYKIIKEIKYKMELEKDELTKSLKRSQSNVCPLTGSKCEQNVEGFIKDRISKISKEYKDIENKYKDIERKCADAKNAWLNFEQLNKERLEILDFERKNNTFIEEKEKNGLKILAIQNVLKDMPSLAQKIKELGDVKDRFGRLSDFIDRNSNVETRKTEIETRLQIISDIIVKNDEKIKGFNESDLLTASQEIVRIRTELNSTNETLKERVKWLDEMRVQIDDIISKESQIKLFKGEEDNLQSELKHVINLRTILRLVPEKLVQGRLNHINTSANEIYNNVIDKGGSLGINSEYEIILNDDKGKRNFNQLSGGEALIASVCIRLAILKDISKFNFIFLDEITMFLDFQNRLNIANSINEIKNILTTQIFVITHSSEFTPYSNYTIEL